MILRPPSKSRSRWRAYYPRRVCQPPVAGISHPAKQPSNFLAQAMVEVTLVFESICGAAATPPGIAQESGRLNLLCEPLGSAPFARITTRSWEAAHRARLLWNRIEEV